MTKTLVIIPTYNELDNLASIATRVLKNPDVDLLVIDDNSPDGTGVLADELATHSTRVHVVHRAGKQGLGTAYCEAFEWGLENGYDVLVELDADGSHAPEQLHRLLERMRLADVVLGSRWVSGGSVVNWPLHRMALSRAGSLYARIALRLPFRDITGGYRAFSAEALHRIDLGAVSSEGYCFQIDMLRRAHAAGLQIEEVPITFVERTLGVSKMSSGIVVEAIVNVTLWAVRARASQIMEQLRGRPRSAAHVS